MSKKEKLYEEKVIKYGGARHYLIRMEGDENFKHHRWDKPAIVPIRKGSEFKKGYFLSGIEYNFEDFNEIMQEREGLPWYKTSAGKGTSRH
jgi:hypothetical protein|tara:strand:+ start:265 stop:537 length:273 start_codon:yes stop_codon:yes gene_type:complete